MADRASATLLEFAIAASAAVVPVLLLVLLAVGFTRSQAPDRLAPRQADRHVSVRAVAALKTFERAIVPRRAVTVHPPSAAELLAGVPQCRAAWDGHAGALDRIRRMLAHAGAEAASPAQRLASHLADLDQALLDFSAGGSRRVSEAVGFDAVRWFDAVALAMQQPIEASAYPGRTFAVQCADIAAAAAMLTRSNARMLAALSWRGTEVERVVKRWRPDQFVEITGRMVARANPWGGLPGCVYFGNARDDDAAATPSYFVTAAQAPDERVCTRPEMFALAGNHGDVPPPRPIAGEPTPELPLGDDRWKVPPSLDVLLQPLATLRRTSGAVYRLYTEDTGTSGDLPPGYRIGANRIAVGGTQVDVGFTVDLTIDPSTQALAQMTAACYTGRQDVCGALGIARTEDNGQAIGHRMLERAMVRMAAVAVIDVATGRIEALAGALSPCTRHEYDGPGRAPGCDKRLPYAPRFRPDALLNAAVFHDAMPASVIKPIMAAAFLSDPVVGPRWLAAERARVNGAQTPAADSLRGQLMRSDSARFLDRMFCADQSFGQCDRPWRIQAMASAFGWNDDCSPPHFDCGQLDLLFGRRVASGSDSGLAPIAMPVPYGRLLAEPIDGKLDAPFGLRPAISLNSGKVMTCAAGGDGRRFTRDDWGKCGGGVVVDVVAEGWGQGHARASALGVAGMLATLAAAANGQDGARKPHLVAGLRGVGTDGTLPLPSAAARFAPAAPEPLRVSRDAAEVIMSGLSYSHRAGTARLACEQVFDARTCIGIDWIAGKTGTPTFPNDDRSLDELWRLCARGEATTKSERAACGPLRPYKWYVAAYRTDRNDPRWTKVIGVLTERNWLQETGRIHGAGDHGPNPAAEIALQIVGRQTGFLTGDPR